MNIPDLDLLLIHHPTGDVHRPVLFPAMGLLGLADYLDRNGVRTQLLHLGVEPRLAPDFDLLRYLEQTGPRVVGLSLHWFFQAPDVLGLAAEIKRRFPSMLLVLGGFSASFFAEEIIREHSCVDVVIRGEGEVPLLELCRSALAKEERGWRGIPNLVYRQRSGGVIATDFDYRPRGEQLTDFSFSNLSLLRHHREYMGLGFYPTRRFRDRFRFEDGGIFPLEVGRGCPHGCTFCGGNHRAQRIINNRIRHVFRPQQSVLESIEEVVGYGCRNFYVSFDPYPNGDYYPELFRLIRERGLDLTLVFGCWGLPDRRLVDAFAETFRDGMFEISPETGDEQLRARNKGPLTFSNAELERCLAYIASKGLLTQLFFGYFLPGDTPETVLQTRRFARRCEGPASESFYLAFSSDPGSPLHLDPQAHDVVLEARTLSDYMALLERPRVSPNLLAHRPRSMSREQADRLVLQLNIDPFLRKVFPRGLQLLGSLLGDDERLEDTLEQMTARVAAGVDLETGAQVQIDVAAVRAAVTEVAADAVEDPTASGLLGEVFRYEAWPYALMSEHFAPVSLHYAIYCQEIELAPDEQRRFAEGSDTVSDRQCFRHDVREILAADLAQGHAFPPPRQIEITAALNCKGQFVVVEQR